MAKVRVAMRTASIARVMYTWSIYTFPRTYIVSINIELISTIRLTCPKILT